LKFCSLQKKKKKKKIHESCQSSQNKTKSPLKRTPNSNYSEAQF